MTIARAALLKEFNNLTTRIDYLRNDANCPDEILKPLIARMNALAAELGYAK